MDKAEYNSGYQEAIKAIKKALKGGNSGGGQGKGQPNDPRLQQPPVPDQGQDGSGQGQGQGEESEVNPGSGQGNGGTGTPGGDSGTSTAREAKKGEVGKLGGSFMDKETGKKLAQEAGYDDNDMGIDENVEKKWEDKGKQVLAGIGSGKGGALGRLLDSIYKPLVNWKSELKKIIGRALQGAKTRNAWGRKAFLQYDEIRRYDKKMAESLEKVIFMIDVSGSDIGCLPILVSETHHICEKKQIGNVLYALYDDGVEQFITVDKPKNVKPSDLKNVHGGGGTSFSKAVDDVTKYIDEHKGPKKIDLLVVLGDADTVEVVKSRPKWAKKVIFVVIDSLNNGPFEEKGWDHTKTIYIKSSDVR